MGDLVVVAMRGYPSSGKTTAAKEMAKEDGMAIVSRDNIRAMMYPDIASDEGLVSRVETATIARALQKGRSIIVDDMNLVDKQLITIAFEAVSVDCYFEICDIETSVEDCIRNRLIYDSRHDEPAIRGLAQRYPIESWSGPDEIYEAAQGAFRKKTAKRSRRDSFAM